MSTTSSPATITNIHVINMPRLFNCCVCDSPAKPSGWRPSRFYDIDSEINVARVLFNITVTLFLLRDVIELTRKYDNNSTSIQKLIGRINRSFLTAGALWIKRKTRVSNQRPLVSMIHGKLKNQVWKRQLCLLISHSQLLRHNRTTFVSSDTTAHSRLLRHNCTLSSPPTQPHNSHLLRHNRTLSSSPTQPHTLISS